MIYEHQLAQSTTHSFKNFYSSSSSPVLLKSSIIIHSLTHSVSSSVCNVSMELRKQRLRLRVHGLNVHHGSWLLNVYRSLQPLFLYSVRCDPFDADGALDLHSLPGRPTGQLQHLRASNERGAH